MDSRSAGEIGSMVRRAGLYSSLAGHCGFELRPWHWSCRGWLRSISLGSAGHERLFPGGVDDVSVMVLFFFMMVFMDTTATIPTGALAER